MQVHINKWLGFFYIVLSLGSGGLSTLAYITDDDLVYRIVPGLIGVLFFWMGVSILIGRVYFKVDRNSLVSYAAIEPLKRTYRFQSLAELKVDKNKVYLNQDGTWKKIAIDRLSANRKEWEAFVQFVQHPG